MPNDSSMRTVLVALGSGLAVALAKVAVAIVTGSSAMAAEAAHSLADTANDLFLFVAQRRSTRRPDDRHPLGYGREAYVKAPIPVMARPTMSVCMVSVPSKVWIASRSTMCRMTW